MALDHQIAGRPWGGLGVMRACDKKVNTIVLSGPVKQLRFRNRRPSSGVSIESPRFANLDAVASFETGVAVRALIM